MAGKKIPTVILDEIFENYNWKTLCRKTVNKRIETKVLRKRMITEARESKNFEKALKRSLLIYGQINKIVEEVSKNNLIEILDALIGDRRDYVEWGSNPRIEDSISDTIASRVVNRLNKAELCQLFKDVVNLVMIKEIY